MDISWDKLLPNEYCMRAMKPRVFERHTEPSANAEKTIGYDEHGTKCFYCHSFMMTADGFDIDEFPIQIETYYERVTAWRLDGGGWVKLKSYSDKMDQCNKHLVTLPIELSDEMPR
ncbi:MAG TPA: hypothetical protein PL131_03330 [Methylotenera sp.]|jgi:hypothetical protein|nr:hypothetical protein [Methylotenera sp.]HPH04882.1 hypothetical protein [Methylotenera sp.]HPN01446.1 hypothetical protein [Methylotenera sp.]